jgi:2-polyprenyl-6-methoxyphenol hydroxylase-like FAD-dependent oxidoreductase
MCSRPNIAVVGAAAGGMAPAGLLWLQGASVTVYEQARQFQRIGAGIQMSLRVLRALGLEPQLRKETLAPRAWAARVWDSGEYLSELTFGTEAERK